MTGSIYHRYTPPLLKGWARWLPIVLLPFCVAFAETWLRMHILHNDYQAAELAGEVRTLESELKELRVEEASLQAMDRIHRKAPVLGLAEPEPNQINILYAAPAPDQRPDPAPEEEPYRLNALAAVQESLDGLRGLTP